MSKVEGRGVAVVTGASAGIGAAYAERLAARGFDLVVVARDAAKLSALAEKVRGGTGRSVEVLAADLTRKADLAVVEERLRSDPAITLLLNNAGIAGGGPLVSADPDQMEAMLDLNIVAPMRLALAAAPGFAARGGTIINVASIVPLIVERFPGVYGSTKAFLLHFSQSLHAELGSKGVRVQAVLPGATATDLWDKSGLPLANLPPEIVMETGAMVDAALAGLDQGELVTIPSLPDVADWEAFEAARHALGPNLSRRVPAARLSAQAASAA
ncbi:SDR family oxidoreductase [Kaistia geumhonensis]|uniref:Short-subunit dehydrogenase n=1 Tax=Kaistia geumhonensis TaxID=410839 RepID=A0ABU0MCD0_9HYPH|nr:SDR family oxidoreductase [Kaistia geumhonensis]MCX5481566.1 SDR family oxidoreductase [Kaistia geumhonensis]MDQ0518632.1 short-subunit dehydrogenase [Kaistia geumhonensis]